MDQRTFNEECRFAKIVETDRGPAVMIARRVYHITGPAGDDAVELFSRAFRQMSAESVDIQGVTVDSISLAAIDSNTEN